MHDDRSVAQRVYEYIVRAGRPVKTREVVAAVGAQSVSAVTFALTRLVREGNLSRVGYATYRVADDSAQAPQPDAQLGDRLRAIFEQIRPVLSFDDLTFLYDVVVTAKRLAPDLFRE